MRPGVRRRADWRAGRGAGRRAAGVLVVSALLTGSLSGCGVLPPMPDPVPSDIVPSAPADLSPAAGGDALSPDGFDAVERMAVRIRNVGCEELSTGSGFAVDEHTLITNKHVVADSKDLEVSTYDGHDITVGATSTAGLADLAVVRTTDPLPSFPELAKADPAPGDPVTVVGYPAGGELTVTEGEVMGTTRDPLNANLGEVLLTNAPVEPGSSGSAALDAKGRVIGVVYAKTADDNSLLVPLSTLQDMLADDTAFTPAKGC